MAWTSFGVSNVCEALKTQKNPRHAPCPSKSNRTAVGLSRPSGREIALPQRSGVSVDEALHRNCGGFTAADAQRRDPALQVLRLQRMQQRDDQPCAGGADRVTECAGAAVDV